MASENRYLRIVFEGKTFMIYRSVAGGEEELRPEYMYNLTPEDIDDDGIVMGEWDTTETKEAYLDIPFEQLADDLKPPSSVTGDWTNAQAYCKIFNIIQSIIASYFYKIGNITPVGSDQKGIIDNTGAFRILGTGDPCGFVSTHFGYDIPEQTQFSFMYIKPQINKLVAPGENFKYPWKERVANGQK